MKMHKYRYISVLFILLIIFTLNTSYLFAQYEPDSTKKSLIKNLKREGFSYFSWNKKNGTIKAIRGNWDRDLKNSKDYKLKIDHFLKDYKKLLDIKKDDDLKIDKVIDGGFETVVQCKQYYNEFEVVSGGAIFSFNRDNLLYSVINSYIPDLEIETTTELSDDDIKNILLDNKYEIEKIDKKEKVIYSKDDRSFLAYIIIAHDKRSGRKYIFYIDCERNNIAYFYTIGFSDLYATGSGDVYSSDSLNSSPGNQTLNNISIDNGIYTLQNSSGHFDVYEGSSGTYGVSNNDGDFNYNEGTSGFTQTNTYYHLQKIYDYFYYLDNTFSGIPNVDVRVWIDNVSPEYFPGGSEGSIHEIELPRRKTITHTYGAQSVTIHYQNYGIDDDGIYHEYTHHMLKWHGIGLDRGNSYTNSLHEGYSDYFALTIASSSGASFSNRGNYVINGNGTYTHTRQLSANSSATCNMDEFNDYSYQSPINPPGSAHANGIIWGSSLWQLRYDIGKSTVDELIFYAATRAGSSGEGGGSWVNHVEKILDYDYTFNSGANSFEIRCILGTDRKIIDPPIAAPEISGGTNVPTGTTITWSSVAGANWYSIQKKAPGEGDYSNLATLLAQTSYTDTDVLDNSTYYYRVNGYADDGFGYWSEPLTYSTPTDLSVSFSASPEPSYYDYSTFTATVSGGSGVYSYAWYTAPENDPDDWTQRTSTTNSLYYKCVDWGVYIRVDVEDDSTVAEGTKTNDYGMAKVSGTYFLPRSFKLYDNFPNPFNPETNIRIDLPNRDFINLQIFNINGKLVKTLLNHEKQAGIYNITWNGKNELGKPVASGVYIYRIRTRSKDISKKLILMK